MLPFATFLASQIEAAGLALVIGYLLHISGGLPDRFQRPK